MSGYERIVLFGRARPVTYVATGGRFLFSSELDGSRSAELLSCTCWECVGRHDTSYKARPACVVPGVVQRPEEAAWDCLPADRRAVFYELDEMTGFNTW